MKNVVIIMAGGKGERFWPMSKADTPKQFLKLTESPLTMIQLTVERILNLVNVEDIFIVTNEKYKNIIFEQLVNVPKENILFEPQSKNTAPCIAYATAIIKKKYGDANVIVLSADHVITNTMLFINNLEIAIKYAMLDNIITLGIVPNRIETGYGYIQLADKVDISDSIYKVKKFVEKPSYPIAKEYYDSGEFLWNSGMFVWKNSVMYASFQKYLGDLYISMKKIEDSIGTNQYDSVLHEEFEKIESESIDYGIMEKIENILVIPGNFGWDDVGSWLSIERLKNSDKSNNIFEGNIVNLDCKNDIIFNKQNDKLIAVSGIENIVVVNTENATLIINKENVADVKKLINKIKENEDYAKYL